MSIITRGLGDPSAIVTRGLGAGVKTPTEGGAVIEEAERLLADIAILEELVADVEEALAPAVDLGLLEETLTFELGISQPVAITLDVSPTVDITAQETVTELDASDTAQINLSATDQATLGLDTVEGLSSDLTAHEDPATTIDGDDTLSGR